MAGAQQRAAVLDGFQRRPALLRIGRTSGDQRDGCGTKTISDVFHLVLLPLFFGVQMLLRGRLHPRPACWGQRPETTRRWDFGAGPLFQSWPTSQRCSAATP